MKGHRHASGLTLLEMMVVLLIAGMALALGYQSLGQWRRAEAAIAGHAGTLRQEQLAQQWLESSIRGLMPMQDTPFAGDATSLSGMTSRPVVASQGGTTVLAWTIEGADRTLLLEEDGQSTRLPLPEGGRARFVYLDKEGKEHDRWPPALGLFPHLPTAVALVQEAPTPTDRSRYWLAKVAGKLDPIEILMYEPETD